MKDVQCYELFGGIALKNHAFSFFFHIANGCPFCIDRISIQTPCNSSNKVLLENKQSLNAKDLLELFSQCLHQFSLKPARETKINLTKIILLTIKY